MTGVGGDPWASQTLVRVLGPVSATVAGRPCQISSPTLRALLALLAVEAGRVVSDDRLMFELWGGAGPESRSSTLQVHVSRLRRALGEPPGSAPVATPVQIRRRQPGYLLEIPDGALDATRLERLADAARGRIRTDPAAALELLDQGLAIVTGEPLSDVLDVLGPNAAAEAQRLSELVVRAREARLDALLESGRPAEAASEAAFLVGGHPLRESLHAIMMLALYRSGRQADALTAYDRLRGRLADELGVDPGPALRRLHAQLLQQDPGLDWQPPAGRGVTVTPTPPLAPPEVDRPAAVDRSRLRGREREVAALGHALEQAAEGQGSVWLVSGEAGIGKTRLVQAVAAAARAARMTVAEGRSSEAGDAPPYWPWLQIFRDLPGVPREGPVAVLLGSEPSPGDSATLTRVALHEATVQVVLDQAAANPLLVVVEDVHWADGATLDLLSMLAERAASDPVMIVCTYRVEEAEPSGGLLALLARLARMPAVERLRLPGLTPTESRELLAERLGWRPDVETAVRAADRTAGNPFFLQELARLVGDADDPQRAWTEVPGNVRDVLVHRLSRLPAPARRLLDVAAVVGRESDLSLLETASGLSADEVDAGLAAAVSSGLVNELVSPAPVLRFPHALVRESIYDQLGARARMRLHAAVGAVMAGRADVDVDDRAGQLLAGGDLVEPEVVITAVLGALDRAMSQLAYDHAQELLQRVLPVLARMPPSPVRDGLELALQARRGTIIGIRAGFAAPEAENALGRALQLAFRVQPSPDVFAAIYRRYLWLLMAADFPAVQALATELLDHAAAAGDAQTRDQFILLGRLARGSALWCLGDAGSAVTELGEALRLGEEVGVGLSVVAFGDPVVRTRMFLCHALAAAGDPAQALEVANEMVDRARLAGPADESDALATRGMMFATLGDPGRARDDGIEGRRLGRLAGATLLGHFAALNEAWGTALTGGPAATSAVEEARTAVEGYRSTGTRMHDPIVYAMLAETEAATGHRERAVAAAETGLRTLSRTGSRLWRERLERLVQQGDEGRQEL